MPHETELWDTHVLFYRHRIFLHRHAALFLTFRRSGSVPAVRKEKRMYFDAKEFGKRLHDVRTSRGITQEELAVRLGLASKQHVSRMENGERSCSIDLLIELSCTAPSNFKMSNASAICSAKFNTNCPPYSVYSSISSASDKPYTSVGVSPENSTISPNGSPTGRVQISKCRPHSVSS